MITLEQLKQITNQKESILIPFVKPLNDTFRQFVSGSKLNQSHFLAQMCHESGSFRYTEEIASGDAYDTRVDLGNTPEKDGDGRRFKGRGIVQITGKTNYKKVSNYFGVDFIKNPDLLETPEWACKSGGWYWESKKLNSYADRNDFLMITYLINGGANGLQDRLKYLKKSFKVLQVPDYQKLLDNILIQIQANIGSIKDTRFKRMLAKEIPDQVAYNKLTDFLSKI